MTTSRPRAAARLAAVALGALGVVACGAVTPALVRPSPAVQADPQLAAVTARYHDYVVAEVAALQTTTSAFTDAIRAGDMAKAKALYAPARMHYEDIEPVVESLGELGDEIDARIDDVSDPAKWTGFHRIEKGLWADGSLAGMSAFANQLDLDLEALKVRVARATYRPADLADGAGELLTAVSTTKVTGEEDRYSHTDLWDVAANISGAQQAFELLKLALAAQDPDLVQQLEARFADVTAGLEKYRQGAGYVDYSTVAQPQRRALADAVNALAEPLSQVAAKVV